MAWFYNALFVAGALLLGQSFYMQAKSQLAQTLIAHSWQQAIDQQAIDRDQELLPAKPWWWADTRAIARLEVPRLKQQVYIMQDSSGESLAFGPGHMTGSSHPGEKGHVMLAGHRDSHFAFLEQIQVGDVIHTQNTRSQHKRYRVTDLQVLNTNYDAIQKLDADRLTLITCYPFKDWVPGGPLRYIVSAELIDSTLM